jgi:biotin transporter BioY
MRHLVTIVAMTLVLVAVTLILIPATRWLYLILALTAESESFVYVWPAFIPALIVAATWVMYFRWLSHFEKKAGPNDLP